MPAIFLIGLPPDVPRGLRLPGAQPGRARLRHVVHLDDQGLRPVRRLDVRLGAGHRHGHRAVQPGRRRGHVLLPVHRRARPGNADIADLGRRQGRQRRDLPGVRRDRDVHRLPRDDDDQGRAVRPRRGPDGRAGAVRRASRSPRRRRRLADGDRLQLSWLNPFSVDDVLARSSPALSLSIFAFWGWDSA